MEYSTGINELWIHDLNIGVSGGERQDLVFESSTKAGRRAVFNIA